MFRRKQKKNESVSILICSENTTNNDKISTFLSKSFSTVNTTIGLSSLQDVSQKMQPAVIILFMLKDFGATAHKAKGIIDYIKQLFPTTKIIVFGPQHQASEFRGFGVLFHSTELLRNSKGATLSPKHVITGLGNHPMELIPGLFTGKVVTAGIGMVDCDLLLDQITLSLKSHEQTIAQLEKEKSKFYDAAAKVFTIRSTETADIKSEIAFLESIIKHKKGAHVLDAGCGLGRISIPLAIKGFSVKGVDISNTLLATAQQNAQALSTKLDRDIPVTFEKQNLLNLQEKKDSYDVVICMWHTICEIKEHRVALFQQIVQVVKVGGYIIFDFPDISKNKHIPKNGKYEHASEFGKYIGSVPQLKEIFSILKSVGANDVVYYKKDWGIPKFVIVARTYGFTW